MARPKNDGRGRIGGRAAGVPNKQNAFTKEMMQKFANEHYEEAWEAWEEIDDPRSKFLMFLRLLEFLVPKMQSVEVKGDVVIPDWQKKLETLIKK